MADILYIDGRFTTTDEKVLSVEDRGFQFGDSVFEVLKFLNGRPLLVEDHFRRMGNGLSELEIRSPWTRDEFVNVCDELLARTQFSEGTIYVQLTRGVGERTQFYPDDMEPTVLAYTRRFRFPDAAKKERGIRVITTEDLRWKHCNVKSVNLLGNMIAKKRAQRAGVDEALLVIDGELKEGASSNFFAVREGRVITHPSDSRILSGTVRDRVISLALGARIRVDERPVRDYELLRMDEAFITSTTQGVMPVGEIDGRVIGNSRRGEITGVLQRLYETLEQQQAGLVGAGLAE